MGYKLNIRNALNSGWNNILQDQFIEHDYTTTGIGTSATDNVELALKYLMDNKDKSSGLEKISDDGSNYGWRLIGKNPNNYGNIGSNAVDLSENTNSSTTKGATGKWSFTCGLSNTSSGEASISVGYNNHAEGNTSFVEGHSNHASGTYGCHAGGHNTISSGESSYTEGYATSATGDMSHAEGYETLASGPQSHSGGRNTIASGGYSFTCGRENTASGDYSFSCGYKNESSGLYAFTEGYLTVATSYMDHASGYATSATGGYGSFSQGWLTSATARSAHAEGYLTEANGRYSHAEGWGTKTSTKYGQHVEGSYNIGTAIDTIHETGIGTSDSDRKNAFEIYTDGTATLPEATTSEIESRGDDAIITKEFLDSYRYRETISTASSAWTITHNLGETLVSVTIMDSSDSTMITPSQISFDSTTELTITFNTPVSGEVLCIK